MGSNIPSEKKLRLAKMLQYLYTSDTSQHSQQEIGDAISWSPSEVGRLAESAEENGLLTVSDGTKPRIYTVTKSGKEFFEEVDPYSQSWENSDAELDFRANLHNVTAEIPLSYPENLPEDWKESMVKVSEAIGSEYWEKNDSVKLESEGFSVRFTSENAFISIDDPIISSDLAESKFEIMDKVLDAKNWIEEETPVNFDDRFLLKISISTQHIAIEGDPLHYFADTHSEVDVTDVELRNEEGELLLWCDCSDGKLHLEMGKGSSKISEDGIRNILNVYRSIVENRRHWRAVVGLIEDGIIEDLHNHIRKLALRIHSLEKQVSDLQNKIHTTDENDSLDSANSDSNSLSIYWSKQVSIKPFITFSRQKEVIRMDDFEEVLREKIQEEVKQQLGMFDTSQRRTENELKDVIQEELEMRPKTVTELRHALDANRSTVINQLEKLEKVDVVEEIEKDGNSYWRQK